ncbi:hypothetical protein OCJ37_13050 [Xanthomonas sp. AM6]|uniref:hypothetical protein n=1 Tax=Xanthomonas sp. AM6 TaxID=2982531 RepID=UPI0021D7E668|nr:hypothetical protein [Xanthomonas sp. AM6]UYB50922.1 hypothetical protein OCJ37_13050 [Xanthomonas sp. AM6]
MREHILDGALAAARNAAHWPAAYRHQAVAGRARAAGGACLTLPSPRPARAATLRCAPQQVRAHHAARRWPRVPASHGIAE